MLLYPGSISTSSADFAEAVTVKRFSNFNSATVRDPQKLKVGKTFSFDRIHEAMAYETATGAKAVLLATPVSA